MAVGNVLGFATGAYDNWGKWLPFTLSDACDTPCANLKSAFLLGTVLLAVTTVLSVTAATEIPWSPQHSSKSSSSETAPLLSGKPANGGEVAKVEDPEDDDEDDDQESEALFWELVVALRDLPRTMWYILLVTCLTWLAWFPFLLFDTDWMGREVYLGEPTGSETSPDSVVYYAGVHMGALGLMLNSVVLGITSLLIDFLCRKLGPSRVWGLGNAIMAFCFASTAIITMASKTASQKEGYTTPPDMIVIAALAVFALLGIPLAVRALMPLEMNATSHGCSNFPVWMNVRIVC